MSKVQSGGALPKNDAVGVLSPPRQKNIQFFCEKACRNEKIVTLQGCCKRGRKWAGGAPHGSSEQDEVGGERSIRYEEGEMRKEQGE